MAFFLKLKLNYLSKMHGYPQFSFWIPRVLTKIYFLRIVLNRAKISLFQVQVSSFKFIQAYLLQVYDKYITKFGNMKHMMYHYSQLATAIRGEQWFDA